MQTSRKGKINSNTKILGYFNTILTCMGISNKEEIQKGSQALNVLLYFLPLHLFQTLQYGRKSSIKADIFRGRNLFSRIARVGKMREMSQYKNDNSKLVLTSICIVQFSSVSQSCLTICDPMNHSTPGLPVHHQLPLPTQTHVPIYMCMYMYVYVYVCIIYIITYI